MTQDESRLLEIRVLEQKLAERDAILERLRGVHLEGEGNCLHCDWDWPCATIRILNGVS